MKTESTYCNNSKITIIHFFYDSFNKRKRVMLHVTIILKKKLSVNIYKDYNENSNTICKREKEKKVNKAKLGNHMFQDSLIFILVYQQ